MGFCCRTIWVAKTFFSKKYNCFFFVAQQKALKSTFTNDDGEELGEKTAMDGSSIHTHREKKNIVNYKKIFSYLFCCRFFILDFFVFFISTVVDNIKKNLFYKRCYLSSSSIVKKKPFGKM